MAKTNVYEMVTERIIAELEKGNIPWHKPWAYVNGTSEMEGAFNRVTKKSYSMLNQMLLSQEGEYASFKQWRELGGKVKKGEKSEMVVFWKIMEKEIEVDGEKEIQKIPLLRYYNVFHISQVEGVEPLAKPEPAKNDAEKADKNTIAEADRIIVDYVTREKIDYREQESNEAFYSPVLDRVVVPSRTQYKNGNEFYSTTFHELVHSTGHKNRLNRIEKSAAHGNEEYSKEELVAEIGAASILNLIGIETPETFKNSAGYVQSWIKVLKNDSKFIVSAASRSEKAVAFILEGGNDKPKKEEDKPNEDKTEEKSEEKSEEKAEKTESVAEKSATQTAKKTRKQGKKTIIKRIVRYAEKKNQKNNGVTKVNINGETYNGYLDGYRILATKEDYGYPFAEDMYKMDVFFDCLGSGSGTTFFRVDLDREKVAECKRENKENKTHNPYIIDMTIGTERRYLGLNPDFLLDAIDFCGVDYCFIDANGRWGKTKDDNNGIADRFFKDAVYFLDADAEKRGNIGLVLPVNLPHIVYTNQNSYVD